MTLHSVNRFRVCNNGVATLNQTYSYVLDVPCPHAVVTYICHGQPLPALALTTLQGNPERQPLVQRAKFEGQTCT